MSIFQPSAMTHRDEMPLDRTNADVRFTAVDEEICLHTVGSKITDLLGLRVEPQVDHENREIVMPLRGVTHHVVQKTIAAFQKHQTTGSVDVNFEVAEVTEESLAA